MPLNRARVGRTLLSDNASARMQTPTNESNSPSGLKILAQDFSPGNTSNKIQARDQRSSDKRSYGVRISPRQPVVLFQHDPQLIMWQRNHLVIVDSRHRLR